MPGRGGEFPSYSVTDRQDAVEDHPAVGCPSVYAEDRLDEVGAVAVPEGPAPGSTMTETMHSCVAVGPIGADVVDADGA